MPERQLGEVPETAVEAGARGLIDCEAVIGVHADSAPEVSRGWEDAARAALKAATDPALGDQRLVPLAAVLEALRERAEEQVSTPFAQGGRTNMLEARNLRTTIRSDANFLARTFGGEPDER